MTTPTPSGHTQLDGPIDVDTAFNTESTRHLVQNTVQATLVGGPNMAHVHDYMKDSYVQHHVDVPDGLNTVIQGVKMLKSAGKESIYTKINHIIADGNFALTISDGTAAGVKKPITICSELKIISLQNIGILLIQLNSQKTTSHHSHL